MEPPERPEIVEIKGAIPVSGNVNFTNSNGERIYTTPKYGGSFLPKSVLGKIKHQKELTEYYIMGLEEAISSYNEKVVGPHNERVSAISKSVKREEKTSWWKLW